MCRPSYRDTIILVSYTIILLILLYCCKEVPGVHAGCTSATTVLCISTEQTTSGERLFWHRHCDDWRATGLSWADRGENETSALWYSVRVPGIHFAHMSLPLHICSRPWPHRVLYRTTYRPALDFCRLANTRAGCFPLRLRWHNKLHFQPGNSNACL